MIIKNTTSCSNNMFRQAAVMSNNKDAAYRRKKLVYNCAGLLCGMVAVAIMSRQLASTGDYNLWLMLPFLAVCAFCLFMGMYYLDKNKYNQIKASYAADGISEINYEIDSEEILVIRGGQTETVSWTNVTNWAEDVNNFYLFGERSLIISKKGFTECSATDFKDLCRAVMMSRKEAK